MDRVAGIRRRLNPWERIDAAGRAAFPVVSTALLLLALSTPIGLPVQGALRFALALACVFFWSLCRPAAMTPLAGFGIGLLADLLGAGTIGVGIIALLAAQGIGLAWRRVLMRQEFLVVWVAFCGVTLVCAAIVWGLDSICTATVLPLDPVLFQAALAAGVYPVLSLCLMTAHRGL